jgi:hypothetical protein
MLPISQDLFNLAHTPPCGKQFKRAVLTPKNDLIDRRTANVTALYIEVFKPAAFN